MIVKQPVKKKKPHQARVQPPLKVPNSSPIAQCTRSHQVETLTELNPPQKNKPKNKIFSKSDLAEMADMHACKTPLTMN